MASRRKFPLFNKNHFLQTTQYIFDSIIAFVETRDNIQPFFVLNLLGKSYIF